MQLGRSGQASQARQQGEVGFAAAPEGRGLGGLEGLAGQLEALLGLARLQQQQQAAHLLGGGHVQGWHHALAAGGQGGEVGFVGGPAAAVGEQIGGTAQQLFPGLKGVVGEALVGGPVDAELQGVQHGLGIGGGAYAEQPEMIDRQFQAGPIAGARL